MAGCCCENKALKLYKNYASRWDEVDWLSILFESEAIDLTGFRATFMLGGFQKEWTDLTDGIIINLTDEETGALPVGLNYATLIVEDTSGNSKPFSTAIPVEVLTWVEGDQEIDTYNMTVNALLDNETQMVIRIETAKVSLDWVLEKIAEHNASEEAHSYIQGLIEEESTARENADSALSDRIDEKQDKLTSENAGVGISIEEVGGKVIISNTQTSAEWGNITGDIQDQQDLQAEFAAKLTTSDILNVLDSTAVDKALSANMGKSLNDRLENVESRGRFLSVWNCVTGLPVTNPEGYTTGQSYSYKRGDYYIVGNVGTTNYKPNGSSYVVGTASTTVETADVKENDTYIYDGSQWILQENVDREVTFSNVAGSPYDNTNLASALNAKQDEITQNAKLSADLVDDSTTTNKFVTATDITSWNGKVDANTAITGATKCKITYDEKGLVTAGGDLASSDVTNALGYTPYSNANPSGYQANVLEGVQVNGTDLTIGVDKKVNIPKASNTTPGVVQTNGSYGIEISSNGYIATIPAAEATLVAKLNGRNVVVANNLDIAVREGLGNNSLTWSDAYKASARTTIGAGTADVEFVDWD